MKKWKIIKIITTSILIIFIIYLISLGIYYRFANIKYPYPALGIDIHNWFEAYQLEVGIILYILGIPLLINIVLLTISIMKTKEKKKIKK